MGKHDLRKLADYQEKDRKEREKQARKHKKEMLNKCYAQVDFAKMRWSNYETYN